MLRFFIPFYHDQFKETFISKRLVLFPENRPLHLLMLNYIICLAIHIVMMLSGNVLIQSSRQLLTYAGHLNLFAWVGREH
jgi:hypothetical protein